MSKSLASFSRLDIALRNTQCSDNIMPAEALLFDTQDLDYAQEKVSEVYCPYRFSLGEKMKETQVCLACRERISCCPGLLMGLIF